jgi:hypothetical protein
MVLRHPTRAYQPDRASRTAAGPPPTQPTTPRQPKRAPTRQIIDPDLTTTTPYQRLARRGRQGSDTRGKAKGRPAGDVPPHPALHEHIGWFRCHASACWTRSSVSCSSRPARWVRRPLGSAVGSMVDGLGMRAPPVAVARDADAGGVEQRDPLLLEDAVAGVAPVDLLPGHPRVLLAKPTSDSPPGVVAEVVEGAFGCGVPEVIAPAPAGLG